MSDIGGILVEIRGWSNIRFAISGHCQSDVMVVRLAFADATVPQIAHPAGHSLKLDGRTKGSDLQRQSGHREPYSSPGLAAMWSGFLAFFRRRIEQRLIFDVLYRKLMHARGGVKFQQRRHGGGSSRQLGHGRSRPQQYEGTRDHYNNRECDNRRTYHGRLPIFGLIKLSAKPQFGSRCYRKSAPKSPIR
jgi:hypothetical protein